MKYQETQHLFYELLDEWKAYHEAARDMRAKVTEAFYGVAKGGSVNPSLGVLAVLELLEIKEQQLQAKMDELVKLIDG
jgi:hypothetical protein